MTVLLLIRHGETDWLGTQLAGRLPDIHLNEAGRAQAEALAVMLRPIPLKMIYSSPLERALETAEPTARAAGKRIIEDERLQEVDFGELTGKPFTELRGMSIWQDIHHTPAMVRYPGGESLSEAQDRAVRMVEELRGVEDAGIVACFTHADTIRLTLAHLLHMPLAAYHTLVADPASISVVFITRKAVRVAGINLPAGSPLQVKAE
ncbi:MAG: histidine phosphatase family protein [Anaerolineales bacterium]